MDFNCEYKNKPIQCEYLEIEEVSNFDPEDDSPCYIYICKHPDNKNKEACEYMPYGSVYF